MPKDIQTSRTNSYKSLKQQVRLVFERGRKRVRGEIVRTYWKAGKLIDSYLKTKPGGDELDRTTVQRLSVDLKIRRTSLFESLRLARTYPKVYPGKLSSWSHYRALLSVDDNAKREGLAKSAERLGWDRAKLQSEIKKLEPEKRPAKISKMAGVHGRAPLLTPPVLGSFHIFRVVGPEKLGPEEKGLWLDLGFAVYKKAEFKEAAGWKAGDLISVQFDPKNRATFRPVSNPDSGRDLYNYRVRLVNIVDGDTLLVSVDLGFGMRTRQYLRLRGIDAPELETRAGKKALKFVEEHLKGADEIRIKSIRSDKYDRYLADVFAPAREFKISADRTFATGREYKNGVYLNQILLNRGFAQRV